MHALRTLPSSLGGNSLHIWLAALPASWSIEAEFTKTLSPQELLRSQRFATSTLRRRFTISHGILRLLLSFYVNTVPAQVRFRYGQAGKPFLDNNNAHVEFNLSHSEDLAVYAFTAGSPLGVDIERLRPTPDLASVASLFFGPQENSDLQSLAEPRRTEAFFRCWTRKEAYLKADGRGLSLALNSFQVSLRPDEPAAFRSLPPGEPHENWQIRDIVHPDYLGAVVFRGPRDAIELPLFEAGEAAEFLHERAKALL